MVFKNKGHLLKHVYPLDKNSTIVNITALINKLIMLKKKCDGGRVIFPSLADALTNISLHMVDNGSRR